MSKNWQNITMYLLSHFFLNLTMTFLSTGLMVNIAYEFQSYGKSVIFFTLVSFSSIISLTISSNIEKYFNQKKHFIGLKLLIVFFLGMALLSNQNIFFRWCFITAGLTFVFTIVGLHMKYVTTFKAEDKLILNKWVQICQTTAFFLVLAIAPSMGRIFGSNSSVISAFYCSLVATFFFLSLKINNFNNFSPTKYFQMNEIKNIFVPLKAKLLLFLNSILWITFGLFNALEVPVLIKNLSTTTQELSIILIIAGISNISTMIFYKSHWFAKSEKVFFLTPLITLSLIIIFPYVNEISYIFIFMLMFGICNALILLSLTTLYHQWSNQNDISNVFILNRFCQYISTLIGLTIFLTLNFFEVKTELIISLCSSFSILIFISIILKNRRALLESTYS